MDNQASPISAEQYSCAKCGAKLNFAPGTTAMKCPFCGFELQIAQSGALITELDYRAYLEKSAGEKETLEARRVKCKQCGAETTMAANATADICPFCGANLVFSESVSRLIKPEGLLPFKIPQKEAFDRFRKWIQGLWFAPGGLKQYARTEASLAGVYIPFWTYDSDTTTVYTGERGDYYYTDETYTTTEDGRTVTRTRRVRHTRWTPAGGTVWNNFDDILILAGKSLPRKYADRLEPWDLANLAPYADEYLSGFRAESYQVTLAEGFEEAKGVMASVIESSIRQDIGGDEQQIHSTQTQYGSITFKHILLPVWLTAYRFREKIFRIIINARTGEVQGERPYSAWKIALAVLAALAVLGIAIVIGTTRQ